MLNVPVGVPVLLVAAAVDTAEVGVVLATAVVVTVLLVAALLVAEEDTGLVEAALVVEATFAESSEPQPATATEIAKTAI